MGMLAISEYIRHGKRNLFVVLQIAVLLFVLCVSVATVLSEYNLYRPVQRMNGKKGIHINPFGYYGETAESIAEGMEKVDSVYTWASTSLDTKEEQNMKTAVYPQEVLEDFEPELEEGRWIDGVQTEDGVIPIVVSKNPYGWKTGALIPMQYYDEMGKTHDVRGRVEGVLKEGSDVIGYNFGYGGIMYHDYRDLFSTYRYDQDKKVFVITSQDAAKRAGVVYTFNQQHIITYQDDVTEYEQKKNDSILKKNLGEMANDTTVSVWLEPFMENSNHQIQRQIMMYLPIVVCVLVITLISLVNVCTLNMADDLYHDAIFSLLGLPWKQCSVFSLIQSIFSAFLSLVIFSVLLLVVVKLKLTEYLLIDLSGETIGMLTGTLIFLCAIHYVVPYAMFCKKQPVEVLRDRKE